MKNKNLELDELSKHQVLDTSPWSLKFTKDLGIKAKDLEFKAKDLEFKAKAKDLRIGP